MLFTGTPCQIAGLYAFLGAEKGECKSDYHRSDLPWSTVSVALGKNILIIGSRKWEKCRVTECNFRYKGKKRLGNESTDPDRKERFCPTAEFRPVWNPFPEWGLLQGKLLSVPVCRYEPRRRSYLRGFLGSGESAAAVYGYQRSLSGFSQQ